LFLLLGRLVYRHRWLVVGLWTLLALVSLPLAPRLPRILKAGGYGDPSLESQRAANLLGSALGWRSSTLLVVFHSDTLTTDDPRFTSAADAAIAPLRALAGIGTIATFADAPQQVAPGHHTAYDTVDLLAAPEDAHRLLPAIRQTLTSNTRQPDR
jgi:hypothetical protein